MPERREIVVQEGETLYSIAQREKGDPNRWPEFFPLNKTVLGHRTWVPAGTVLVVEGEEEPDPQPSAL